MMIQIFETNVLKGYNVSEIIRLTMFLNITYNFTE